MYVNLSGKVLEFTKSEVGYKIITSADPYLTLADESFRKCSIF